MVDFGIERIYTTVCEAAFFWQSAPSAAKYWRNNFQLSRTEPRK